MRFSTVLAAVAVYFLPAVVALSPSNCNTSNKARTGSDFVLEEQADNPHVKSLAKKLKRVTVAHVFDDGNHKMTSTSQGLRWEKTSSFNDVDTSKWVPQGITSTADALDAGTYEGKDGWIVSWHRNDDKSVRVTFVNRKTNKYRHALLVYPHAADNFKAVPIHAGGIMWYGNTLWVVDTKNGIRVFDLDNIWQVSDGDGVGKKSGGGYSAAGYKYVIPQIRWYKWTSSFPFRFSFISLDRTTSPDSLIVGEYQKSTSEPIRLVRFQLDYKTRKLVTSSGKKAKGTWAYCVGIERMQGAVSANGKFYISRSNGNNRGDIFGWVPGKTARKNGGIVPRGPEDLSYDKRNGGHIYTVTEHAGTRYIVDLKVSSIKTS